MPLRLFKSSNVLMPTFVCSKVLLMPLILHFLLKDMVAKYTFYAGHSIKPCYPFLFCEAIYQLSHSLLHIQGRHLTLLSVVQFLGFPLLRIYFPYLR